MSRHSTVIAIDVAIAVALAVLVLVVSPGIAVTGMIALFVIVVCAISLGIERWRGRTRRPSARRRR